MWCPVIIMMTARSAPTNWATVRPRFYWAKEARAPRQWDWSVWETLTRRRILERPGRAGPASVSCRHENFNGRESRNLGHSGSVWLSLLLASGYTASESSREVPLLIGAASELGCPLHSLALLLALQLQTSVATLFHLVNYLKSWTTWRNLNTFKFNT